MNDPHLEKFGLGEAKKQLLLNAVHAHLNMLTAGDQRQRIFAVFIITYEGKPNKDDEVLTTLDVVTAVPKDILREAIHHWLAKDTQ